jgi:hypothetical protein
MFQEGWFNGAIQAKMAQPAEGDAEDGAAKKVFIAIDEATIKMTELCEEDYDTPEALKYLSNIEHVLLRLQKVKLNEEGFKVECVSLGVKKYERSDELLLSTNSKSKSENKELLKIDSLLITKEGKVTNISHNDVKLSCQKEELALLGKLFTLINSRVIKD